MLTAERLLEIEKLANRHETSRMSYAIRDLLKEREEMQQRAAEFSQKMADHWYQHDMITESGK